MREDMKYQYVKEKKLIVLTLTCTGIHITNGIHHIDNEHG